MTDEDETLPVRSDDGELLLYDFFKHLTSLALLTLGGVLIVIKDVDPKDVKPFMIITDIAIISLSGILAFSGSGEIARARYTATPTNRSLELCRKGAPALLAIGVGIFLSMFVDSLN